VPQANQTSRLIFLSINLSKTYLDLGFWATQFKITQFTKRTHSHLKGEASFDHGTYSHFAIEVMAR
jgi:hypothetical protein